MLRVRTVWTGVPGAPYYQNLYFAGSTQTQADDAHAAVTAMLGAFAGSMRSNLVGLVESDVPKIDEFTGQAVGNFSVTPQTITCTGSGDPLPNQIQGLVFLRTGEYRNGRQVVGRVFHPGLLEAWNNDGRGPYSTGRDALTAGYSTLVDPGNGLNLVVYSRKHASSFPVQAVIASDVWGTLRSRRGA